MNTFDRAAQRKQNWDKLHAIIDRHLDAYPTYPINRDFTSRDMSKEAWASWRKADEARNKITNHEY